MNARQNLPNLASVIIGPGALGLFLARELVCQKKNVILVGRRKIENSVTIESGCRVWSMLSEVLRFDFSEFAHLFNNFDSALNYNIFLTVSPDAVDEISEWLFTELNFTPQKNINLIYCNNGFLSKKTTSLIGDFLDRALGKIQVIRALFFAGFMKEIFSDEVRVIHSGGNVVRYGEYFICSGFEFKPVEYSLKWLFESDIRFIEAAKFFTNFCLAFYIGANTIQNCQLLSLVSMPELTEFAKRYVKIFPDCAWDYQEVLKILLDTVQGTGKNINSISLSRVKNNHKPWLMMQNQLQEIVSKSGNDGAYWQKYLQQK